jgi:DNA-binding NtrC family response regulator
MIRSFTSTALKDLGYNVLTAVDGHQGVEIFRRHHSEIDLVVMDMIMPNLDGKAMFEKIIKIDPDVRVIVSSGFCSSEATNSMISMGAIEFVPKPFRISELSQAVARCLSKPKQGGDGV